MKAKISGNIVCRRVSAAKGQWKEVMIMKKAYRRIFTIVLDSFGVGAMEDSPQFGDVGVDTLGHISESVEEFKIPNLQKL